MHAQMLRNHSYRVLLNSIKNKNQFQASYCHEIRISICHKVACVCLSLTQSWLSYEIKHNNYWPQSKFQQVHENYNCNCKLPEFLA